MCAFQLKVVQARLAGPGHVRHLQMKVIQVSDPNEFPRPILCLDGDEEFLPGVCRRGSRSARTGFIRASGGRRPGEQRRKSRSRAADQVVVSREQLDGDLVLGRPAHAGHPYVANLKNIAVADDVLSVLSRESCGIFR